MHLQRYERFFNVTNTLVKLPTHLHHCERITFVMSCALSTARHREICHEKKARQRESGKGPNKNKELAEVKTNVR